MKLEVIFFNLFEHTSQAGEKTPPYIIPVFALCSLVLYCSTGKPEITL